MEPSSRPILSIVLPTFNRAESLEKSLACYTSNPRQDIEFVVSDNCSQDSTEQVVRVFLERDSRIRYFKNPENLGFTRNLFLSVLRAKARWITILCDDDLVTANLIDVIIQSIKSHPTIGFLQPAQAHKEAQTGRYKLTPYLPRTRLFDPGLESFKFWFRSVAFIPGLTLNLDKMSLSWWKLDAPVIYPHRHFISMLSINHSSLYLVSNETILGNAAKFKDSHSLEITQTINTDSIKEVSGGGYGYIGRPLDLGLFELIDCAKVGLTLLGSQDDLDSTVFFLADWYSEMITKVRKDDFNLSRKMIKHLHKHSYFHKSNPFICRVCKVLETKGYNDLVEPIKGLLNKESVARTTQIKPQYIESDQCSEADLQSESANPVYF